MTVKGGTTPACAACKYQRRRCTADCPLAPYFPASKAKLFQNVHRLFGVSSITKTLKNLRTQVQKDDAMKSIIYEADMRQKFPVYGCSVIICHLKVQIEHASEELRHVRSQLAMYREQVKVNNQPEQPTNSSEFVNENQDENYGFLDEESSMGKTFMGFDYNLAAIQTQMNALGFQDRDILYRSYQDVSFNPNDEDRQSYAKANVSFNPNDEDRQSYAKAKEICQSSSESSLKGKTKVTGHVELRKIK